MTIVWALEDIQTKNLSHFLMSFFPVRSFQSLDACLKVIHKDDYNLKPNILILNKKLELREKKSCLKINSDTNEIIIIDLFTNKEELNFKDEFFIPFTKGNNSKKIQDKLINLIKLKTSNKNKKNNILSFNSIHLDTDNRKFCIAPENHWTNLTKNEFFLLKELILQAGTCIKKQHIKHAVWGTRPISDKAIDINICRLRRKIQDSDVMISNIYSQGYKLQSTSQEDF